jgi:hypothetical protein
MEIAVDHFDSVCEKIYSQAGKNPPFSNTTIDEDLAELKKLTKKGVRNFTDKEWDIMNILHVQIFKKLEDRKK